ncbi:MAG: Crp/Fnr family transcriptional regulator [Thermonemataceae bacterium]
MEIVEAFIAYLSKFGTLTEVEKKAIKEDIDIRTIPKGVYLLKEGQVAHYNYCVLDGCVRQYYLHEGQEKTSHFFTTYDWILPSIGLSDDRVVPYYLTCTEASTLVFGNEQRGQVLMQQFPKIQDLSLLILEKEIVRQQKQLAKYINSTPEQRYQELMEHRPELIERVPQYQLASYIGVKPESLSRIRKRLSVK